MHKSLIRYTRLDHLLAAILITLLHVVLVPLTGQIPLKEAEIYTLSGDTLKGYIGLKSEVALTKECRFQFEPESPVIIYFPLKDSGSDRVEDIMFPGISTRMGTVFRFSLSMS